ncbi:LacI family DNA-binding transcriptional regulator (plasmid) [Agrobacterium leguminum]|uniref:Transcriptional regulator n=1 Tax=Agrobacterium deltaense NCPPB 1641 TaxID=1183425 RepID=A0A1S7UBB0_9HYPH|nr:MULTISPECIES: LacI family DNA-binding transcriptional regulator [Agrobacterium]WFS69781.1 LacI family DNA-binding transcriptional regulator [Agrobacterium leguminum]CVI64105.1 Transcriptional regulator [Agrobacterium deltaense NCPPB 1641]
MAGNREMMLKEDRKPTLADIAAKTGYGVNTVSLALRGSTRISQTTREIIVKAAEALDYVPNNSAKSLVLKRTNTVGMLVEYLTNPQPTAVATALQREMSERGYSVLFATSSTPEQETAAIEMFRRHMVDGLLIYPVDHTSLDHLRRLRERNFPIVMLVGARDTGLDAVGVDEFQASYNATTHLIALGHTKIGGLGPIKDKPLKLEGFRHAHRVHGLPLDDRQIFEPVGFSMAAGFDAMSALAERKLGLTAIFAASDMFALGAMRWANVNGISVPEELSIVGYDNIEFGEFSHTTLTSVRNDGATLAKAAVERLVALMEAAPPLPPPTITLLPGELILRESSSRPGMRAWVSKERVAGDNSED